MPAKSAAFKSVYEARLAIMRDAAAIPLSERSPMGYSFRGIQQVLAWLQPQLVAKGLVMTPSVVSDAVQELTWSDRNGVEKKALLTRVTVDYTFTLLGFDGTNEATHRETMRVIGQGADAVNPPDKGAAQALSTALKAGIFQAFSIPTEDQPDTEANEGEDHSQPFPDSPAARRTSGPAPSAPSAQTAASGGFSGITVNMTWRLMTASRKHCKASGLDTIKVLQAALKAERLPLLTGTITEKTVHAHLMEHCPPKPGYDRMYDRLTGAFPETGQDAAEELAPLGDDEIPF